VVCILICKRCKFGEKICNNSRDIEFFLGDYFFGAPCTLHYVQVVSSPMGNAYYLENGWRQGLGYNGAPIENGIRVIEWSCD